MHLEALDLAAVLRRHDLALEAQVGGLDACAGIGAAVDVDGEWGVERREPLLQLRDGSGGPSLRLDDGELAVLDAGACHGATAKRRGCGFETQRRQARDEVVNSIGGGVPGGELLLPGPTDPGAAGGRGGDGPAP